MTNYSMIIHLELNCVIESHEPNPIHISSVIQSYKPNTPKYINDYDSY